MVPRLTQDDCDEIHKELPGLRCDLAENNIRGILKFQCFYDAARKGLVCDSSSPERLEGEFDIEIQFNTNDRFGLPKVYERAGKAAKAAKQLGIPILDLHIDKNGWCCLGIFPRYKWTSAYKFINELVTPFFFWVEYRIAKGKEPWPAYPHGTDGLDQAIEELQATMIAPENFGRNAPCPCKSGKKYKKCCLHADQPHIGEIMFIRNVKQSMTRAAA